MILEDERDWSEAVGIAQATAVAACKVETAAIDAFKAGRDDEAKRLRTLVAEIRASGAHAELKVSLYAQRAIGGASSRSKREI